MYDSTARPAHWADPANIGENVLQPHGAFIEENSLSLNGTWSFRCALNPKEGTPPFWSESFSGGADWTRIQVPGCWEPQGFGKPYYFACGFPAFVGTEEGKIPQIDETQVYVGQYRRRFPAPPIPEGGRAVLVFGGVKSAFRCWDQWDRGAAGRCLPKY